MKKSLLLFVFNLSMCLYSNAQTYVPFPTGNATWTEKHEEFDAGVITRRSIFNVSISANSDTLILGKIYKKISNKRSLQSFDSTYVGGIREENKKIYFISGLSESLLYDFSAKLNDTLKGLKGSPYDFVVVNIDSVKIGTQFRKRFYIATRKGAGFRYKIIEGIGSDVGLIPYYYAETLDNYHELTCFSVNGNLEYVKTGSSTCLVPTSDLPETVIQSKIHPNPVSDVSILDIPNDKQADEVVVYDFQGRIVQQYRVTGTTVAIPKRDFPSGIYFAHVFNKKQRIAFAKFMVE